MMKPLKPGSVSILIALVALVNPAAAWTDQPQRIWILPFEQLQADPAFEYLAETLPAMLTIAVSQSGDDVVVERQNVNELLEELSLTLEGLTSGRDRHRIGKLLGATVLITGSYTQQDGRLLVNVRGTDLETGIITATASLSGSVSEPHELVGKLYRAAFVTLGGPSLDAAPGEIDRMPVANLHLMKGLGHYFSARYSLALAEFLRSADEEEVNGTARLWLARTYMADAQYGHAYLELVWLMRRGSGQVAGKEIALRMRECERHLSAGEVKRIRRFQQRDERRTRPVEGAIQ